MTSRGLLLDTHVWLWTLDASPKLAAGLRKAIAASVERLWLSPVSLWEAGFLAKRGRIRVDTTFRDWADDMLRRLPVVEAPVTSAVAVATTEFDLPHGDPADRFLLATARVYDLTLLTLDRNLAGLPGTRSR
ncbi:MAG: type II toxin-antitoxin system VapC family toxin [Actinomycetota bacterium]